MKECIRKSVGNMDNQELIDLYDGPPNSGAFYDLGWKQALEWVKDVDKMCPGWGAGCELIRALKQELGEN